MFTNCVIDENYTDNGGNIRIEDDSVATLKNVILSSNTQAVIYEAGSTSEATAQNCLFHDNPDGHFYDADTATTYTDVATLQANVPEVTNCLEGDPLFIMDGPDAITGTWDQDRVYDNTRGLTRMTATGAFAGLNLAGRLIIPDTAEKTQSYILSHDDDTLVLTGNVDWAENGDTFKIVDYHLLGGSPAIDAADGDAAPELDMEGDARYDDPLTADVGTGDPTYADIGVDEATSGRVETNAVTNIKAHSAVCGGQVLTEGVAPVTAAGLCWSTTSPPTTADSSLTLGSGPCAFSASLTGLTPATTYFVRAWATNAVGTVYGDVVSFATLSLGLVNAGVSGGAGDGSSWADAYASLQDAVDAMDKPTELWVAAGTYTGTLTLASGVELHGGFDSHEADLGQRNPGANKTILDADGADHVLVLDSVSDVIVDGFTLTGGVADGAYPDNSGGGIWAEGIDASVLITDCAIHGNSANAYGGGISLLSSSPILSDCVVAGNSALDGGGMALEVSSPSLTGCMFSGNAADFGGAMSLYASSPTLTNCVLSGNEADYVGGMYIEYTSAPTLTNCVLHGNETGYGGCLVLRSSSTASLANVIFSSNQELALLESTMDSDATLRYCLFHNHPAGAYYDADTGITYTDVADMNTQLSEVSSCVEGNPLFVMRGDGSAFADFRIRSGSPAIDAGDGDAAPVQDFEGDARHDDPDTADTGTATSIRPTYTDIGVDEFTGVISSGAALNPVYFILLNN